MQNSPISWFGGKRLLRKTIISKFPVHKCYVEVFAGGAWVMFGKDPSHTEVLNDIDNNLINFYQVIKTCPHEFLVELQYDLVSRNLFSIYKDRIKKGEVVSNVEKAKIFYYLIKASFGGQGDSYGYGTTSKPKLNLTKVNETIMEAYNRLQRVNIENIDFRKLIEKYDRKHTLFYLDPPYRVASSKNYFKYMTDEDYKDLSDILKKIKGKFILSINDDEFIKKLFSYKKYRVEIVTTNYSIMNSKSKKVNELLIMNF